MAEHVRCTFHWLLIVKKLGKVGNYDNYDKVMINHLQSVFHIFNIQYLPFYLFLNLSNWWRNNIAFINHNSFVSDYFKSSNHIAWMTTDDKKCRTFISSAWFPRSSITISISELADWGILITPSWMFILFLLPFNIYWNCVREGVVIFSIL